MDCRAINQQHMLDRPLPDLAAWVAHFLAAPIPVLASTAEAIEAMRLREDDVDANLIGEMVAGDPWMTLRVLSHAAANRPPRMLTVAEEDQRQAFFRQAPAQYPSPDRRG